MLLSYAILSSSLDNHIPLLFQLLKHLFIFRIRTSVIVTHSCRHEHAHRHTHGHRNTHANIHTHRCTYRDGAMSTWGMIRHFPRCVFLIGPQFSGFQQAPFSSFRNRHTGNRLLMEKIGKIIMETCKEHIRRNHSGFIAHRSQGEVIQADKTV